MDQKNENKEGTKRVIFTILGVLILLCSVLVIGFSIFVFEDTSNHENAITTGTIDDSGNGDSQGKPGGTISFSYNETSNGIELVNAIPTDDEIGKNLTNSNKAEGINQGYFDFAIQAKASTKQEIKYQIYATLEDDSNMDTKYIKVYLTDDNDQPYKDYVSSIPVFSALDDYKGQAKSKVLYSDTIRSKKNTVKRFRLRLWVAKDYSDGSTSKTFKIKVNVKATA